MKQGWTQKKLGDVCKLYQPHTISSKEMVDDGLYNVYGANGIIGKYNQYNHEYPEILMTCRGATCGNINISTPKSWINGNAMVVHIMDESILLKKYLVYFLSFIDKTHIITGAAQPQITRQTLAPLEIIFPSYAEQQRIVERLDAAFAQIDELKKNAERQLAEARALFQSALTQAMQPKPGWQEKTLGDCINKIPKQKQVKSKDYQSSGKYPIVSQDRNIISGYWDDESFLYKHERPVIIFGDHTKEIKYIDFNFVVGADGTQILSPKDGLVAKFFYYALLATPIRNLGYARHFKLLKEKLFLVPQITEQQRIVEQLDALSNDIYKLEEISRKTAAECDALKQALLRQIFE